MAGTRSKLSTREMQKVANMLIRSPDKLNTQEMTVLGEIVGEEAIQKLQELEAYRSKNDT